jgi:hypothetical protein
MNPRDDDKILLKENDNYVYRVQGYLLFFALEQLGGSLQRRKMRIYDS